MKKILEIVYLVTSVVGAAIIAANINANVAGYVLFLISSVIGSWLAFNSNVSQSIVIVNVMFGMINLIGIIRYMA